MSFDVEEATVADVRGAIEAGETTASEIVAESLRRIERLDGDLNAIITVNEGARERAASLDEAHEESGLQGPLHGVPVVLKDNFDTGDLPTTGGSAALDGVVPADDAFTVRRLREAGGVIVAKANLHEMAGGGVTVSTVGGQTRNPYDLDRTPGGSSGGTGAAIAANMGVVGTGSDTVNSIRSPASACNLVGLRPSRGLVSRDGLIPVALTQDMPGPITRTVADAAEALTVMAGYDPADPDTARGDPHVEDYTEHVDPDGLDGARLGVLRSVFGDGPEAEPVNGVMDDALDDMTDAGATLVEVTADLDVSGLIDRLDVKQWETWRQLDDYFADLPDGPGGFVDYRDAYDHHPTLAEKLSGYEHVDVEDLESSHAYLRRLYRRRELRERLAGLLAADDLDAFVFPHQKQLVAEIGAEDQPGRNGFLSSGTGFASITVPGGFAEGVPVGVEFLSPPFTEPTLLEVASGYEAATGHRRPPEGFSLDGE